MALTDAQVIKVRRYLGYSITLWQDDPLTRMLNDLSSAGQTEVIDIITKIAAIDSAVNTTATSSSRIGIKKVEDVEFFGSGESFAAQNANRAQLVSDLSNLLGVPVKNAGGGGRMSYVGG